MQGRHLDLRPFILYGEKVTIIPGGLDARGAPRRLARGEFLPRRRQQGHLGLDANEWREGGYSDLPLLHAPTLHHAMLSRVADSLYWMSRYIERAENNARIADVNLQLLLDLANPTESGPATAMGSDHQLARGKRALRLALRQARRQSGDRFRQPAEEESELHLFLSDARARKCPDHERTNFERDVGADQSPLSLREKRLGEENWCARVPTNFSSASSPDRTFSRASPMPP